MKRIGGFRFKSLIMSIPVMSFFFCTAVWSQNNSGNMSLTGPVSLKYNYPGSKSVKYLNTSKMVQTMDINGQSMNVNVNGSFGCTIKASGFQGQNLKLDVVVDTLAQSTESPMGLSGGPVTDVNGKSFSVIIAPDGHSIDFTEAEKIVYNIEGSGESNLTTTFNDFFPVLPANPVKTGDTWTTVDTLKTNTKAMSGTNVVNAVNTLDSLYIFDGVEWARIRSKLTGTQKVTVQNQGMEIKMSGPYEGNSVVQFAVKQGYFVKQNVNTKLTGNIEMSQPDVVTFPIVMTMTSTSEMLNEVQK